MKVHSHVEIPDHVLRTGVPISVMRECLEEYAAIGNLFHLYGGRIHDVIAGYGGCRIPLPSLPKQPAGGEIVLFDAAAEYFGRRANDRLSFVSPPGFFGTAR